MNHRLLFALCATLLVAGCAHELSKAEKAYDAIGRIQSASSRTDLEARVRDADAAIDEAQHQLSSPQFMALTRYELAAKSRAAGSGEEYYFDACRDDAWRSLHGDSSSMNTKAGDCDRISKRQTEDVLKANKK